MFEIDGKNSIVRIENQMLSVFHRSVQIKWRGSLETYIIRRISNYFFK